jgi:hypothetical protein
MTIRQIVEKAIYEELKCIVFTTVSDTEHVKPMVLQRLNESLLVDLGDTNNVSYIYYTLDSSSPVLQTFSNGNNLVTELSDFLDEVVLTTLFTGTGAHPSYEFMTIKTIGKNNEIYIAVVE